MTADNDNTLDPENRRRKLKFRAWHRGMKEMDLLLSSFADQQLDSMSAGELDLFEAMLHVPDQALYSMVLKSEPVPAELDHAVMQALIEHVQDPGRRL